MANQACISIGINQYQYLPPLGYGMADAVAMEHFFVDAAGWNPSQCLLLTDTSPKNGDRSTYPDRENINRWLQQWSWDTLRHGDLLWFFFSGCGVSFEGEDYLMPIDGTLTDIEHTCISMRQLYRQFSEIGVNALVFLDANHSQHHLALDGGIGKVTAKLAQEYQIPTFLSCQSHELSHEDAGLGHGLFTTALLEALNYHPDLNLETIETYLTSRLAELGEHHWKPLQTPLTVIPTGVSGYRPVFSATTQSTISATFPEPIYTPPAAPAFGRDEYAPYTPPTTGFVVSSPTGTGAIVRRSPLTPTPKHVPHWAKIGVLLTLIVAAGGLIYLLTARPTDREQPTVQPATNNLTTPTVGAAVATETSSIAQAIAKVRPSDATSRYVAILTARKIPATTPAAAAEVQQSIELWSQEISLIAHGHARKQRWQIAIDTAKMVPPDATNYADVQIAMAKWRSRL